MCTVTTALAVASGGLKMVGQNQQARAVNSAARQTFRSSLENQAFQNAQNDRQRAEEGRQIAQSGYDARLQAAAGVSAAQNTTAGGTTIGALIAEEMRTGAVNQGRIADRLASSKAAHSDTSRSIQARTQATINQTPTAQFGMLDILQIATDTAMNVQSARKETKKG